ncbi:hypothetical protein ACIPIC_02675 [Streptomyces collinus]|uniref:hypothetical protein n=1 Tax=Streptomyces collinus TaxID=42684 RepID=UPI0038054234
MLADDPRLSPLWAGRRAQFAAFQDALTVLAGAYDLRDGRSDDLMSRVSLSTDDWHGQPIVPARRFPVAAFDDVLLAVQLLAARHRAENRASGWTAQVDAERRAAVWECWEARGTDRDAFRAGLRDDLAESARRYGITPNDLI